MKNKKLISKLGYRDDSPYRDKPFIDINTPTGEIDMSKTGIPLWANGRILPPYSGIHHFDEDVVREIPLAQDGGPKESDWTTWLNPFNWGVDDYTDKGDFNSAYASAKKSGEKEFIWNNKRFSTARANENPYKVNTFNSSFIPKTYLNNNWINNSKKNVIREKRDINLNEGKLYFQRTNEATEGNIILGGDYIEDEPTAYSAYDFKNNITERYESRGEKVKIDNETQLYYGIVNNKLKTGKITSFNDDDIVVPIRYGGKYDKKNSLSKEEKAILTNYNNVQNKINQIDLSGETITNFFKGKERPFWRSRSGQKHEYKEYKIAEILKESNLSSESWDDLKKDVKNLDVTFTRNGKPIYNSGVKGKVILHSPSTGKQLFLFKNNIAEVKVKSQQFLEKHPDAEFISLDTGRYNFLVENEEGLKVNDFKTYQEADIRRGKKIGYNIVYDNMMHDYGDGQKKKMYYSDKELSELNINEKNFDTLALQRELSNRGYKLPKSTKKDDSFDGMWGNETKKALKDWKSKNKMQAGGEQIQPSVFSNGGELPQKQDGGTNSDKILRQMQFIDNKENINPRLLKKIENNWIKSEKAIDNKGYPKGYNKADKLLKRNNKYISRLQEGGSRKAPSRKGVRLNYDEEGNVIGESSHIMKTETLDGIHWFSFPTLFQNEDGSWLDMSEESDKDWRPAMLEAKKRGELIHFGADKEEALAFGEGSWKDLDYEELELTDEEIEEYRRGGHVVEELPKAQNGLTVSDPNHPRLTSYRDSLDLFNFTKAQQELEKGYPNPIWSPFDYLDAEKDPRHHEISKKAYDLVQSNPRINWLYDRFAPPSYQYKIRGDEDWFIPGGYRKKGDIIEKIYNNSKIYNQLVDSGDAKYLTPYINANSPDIIHDTIESTDWYMGRGANYIYPEPKQEVTYVPKTLKKELVTQDIINKKSSATEKLDKSGTIYTSDPNDPRIKVYSDSLAWYNDDKNYYKGWLNEFIKPIKVPTYDDLMELKDSGIDSFEQDGLIFKFEDGLSVADTNIPEIVGGLVMGNPIHKPTKPVKYVTKKQRSYADAYKNVDKKKYPTLESFIEEAENYKNFGSNTKPESKSKETKVLKSEAKEKKLKEPIVEKEIIKKPEIPEGYTLSKGYQRDGISYGDMWHDSEGSRPAISAGPTMDDYYIKYPKSSDIAIDDEDFQLGGQLPKAQWGKGLKTAFNSLLKKPKIPTVTNLDFSNINNFTQIPSINFKSNVFPLVNKNLSDGITHTLKLSDEIGKLQSTLPSISLNNEYDLGQFKKKFLQNKGLKQEDFKILDDYILDNKLSGEIQPIDLANSIHNDLTFPVNMERIVDYEKSAESFFSTTFADRKKLPSTKLYSAYNAEEYKLSPNYSYSAYSLNTPTIKPIGDKHFGDRQKISSKSDLGSFQTSVENTIGHMRGFENLKDPTHFVVMENQSDVMQAGKDGHNIKEVLHENYSIPHQEGINENKFLKLLQGDKNTKSKDRRWMKLQTNSIVQQLVKEGYTTIDFPLGKLATKTQGHRYTPPNEVAEYKHLNETNKEEIDELNTSKANLEKKQSKNYPKGNILVEKKQRLSTDIVNQHLANEGYVLEDLYKHYKIHPQDPTYTKISDFRQYDAEINKIFNNAWRDLVAIGGVKVGTLASKEQGIVNADKKLIEDYTTTVNEYNDWEQNSELFETQVQDMSSHLRKIGGIKPKLSSSQINYDGSHRKFLEKEFKHWLTETVDEFGYPILRLKVNPDLIKKVNNIKYQQGGELPKAQYGKFLSRLNKNLGTTLQNNVLKKFDINDFRNYSDDFYKNLINSSNEKLTQGLGIKKLPMNIKLEHPGKSGGLINVSMSDKNSPFVKTGELILAPVHSSHDFPNLHQRTATNILLNQKGPETFGIPKFKVDNNSYFFRNQSDLSDSEKRLYDAYSRIPTLEAHTTFDKDKFIDFGNRGLRKEWDAPFGGNDGNNILKGQGLSGEINEAINQAMKERGMSLFSGTTSHSTEGGDRYANLLQKGLIDPITNIPEINLHLDRLKKDPNTIENLSQYIVDNDVTFKYKKEGGEYLDLDLTEDQIKNFKDGGFVVKDLPKAQNGKIIKPIINNFLRKYNINTSGFTNKINTKTASQLMKEASNFGLTAVPTSKGTYYLSQDGNKPYNLAKLYDDWRIKGSTKNLHELESFYLESMGKTHDKREMIEKYYKDSPITYIQGSELRLEDYNQLTDVGFHNANKLWKPEGLWYGKGNGWRDWVDGNMPEWKGRYKTPISLDLNYGHGIDKVIKLTRPELVQEFTNTFQKELMPDNSMMSGIDWSKVATRFGGVEISPYNKPVNFNWTDTWDVDSGAVWNKKAIKGYKKILGRDQIDQSRREWDYKKGGELPKAQFGDLLPKFIKGITPKIPKAHQFNIGKDLRKFYNFEDDLLVALSKMGKDPGMPDFDINNYYSWAANLDKLPLSSSTMKEALEMSDFAKKDLTTRLKAFGHSTDDITKYLDKGLNLRLSKERFADKFNMLRKETDLPLSDWHFPNGTAPIAFQDHYRGDQLKSHMNKIGDPNKLSGWLKVKGDTGIPGAFSGKDFLWEKFLWDKFKTSDMEEFPRQGKFNALITDVSDDLFKQWQNKINKSYDVLNASQKELMYNQRSTPFREAGYEPMNKQLMQTLSGEFIENKKGGSVNKFQGGGTKKILSNILKTTLPLANKFENISIPTHPFIKDFVLNNKNLQKPMLEFLSTGITPIQNYTKTMLEELKSPEGSKRLFKQESEYMRKIGMSEEYIDRAANLAVNARLKELDVIGMKNNSAVKAKDLLSIGDPKEIENFLSNDYLYSNASYSPATESAIDSWDPRYFKDRFGIASKKDMDDMAKESFNLNKTRLGIYNMPGSINIGADWNFPFSTPVLAHELRGHGLQRGRKLKIDSDAIKLIKPKKELNESQQEAYNYFKKSGKEPSAFLNELREAMLSNGLIKKRYEYITPQKLKMASTFFKRKPMGIVKSNNRKHFSSNTRILDFMDETPKMFMNLSSLLNRLPSVAGAIGTGAALYNNEEVDTDRPEWNFKKGGSVPTFQDGGGYYYIDPKTKKRVWIENVRENSDRGYYDNKGYWHNQPLILSEFKNEEEFKAAEEYVEKDTQKSDLESSVEFKNEQALKKFKKNYPKKYKNYIANKKKLQKNTKPDELNAKRTDETGTYKDKSVNIYEGSFDDAYNLARYHTGENLLSEDAKDVFGWKNPNTGKIEYKHIYSAGEIGEWSDGTPYVPGYSKEFLDAHPEFVKQVKEYKNFSDEELKKYNIDTEESQKKREEVETFMKDKPEFAQYFKNKKALKDNPDLFNEEEKYDIDQQNEEVYQNAYKEHYSNVTSSETRKNVLNEAKNKSSYGTSQSGTPDITNPERFSYNDKVKVKDEYNGDGKYNSEYFSNEQLKNILHDEKNSYMAPEKIEELKKLEYIEQNHERRQFEMTTKQKDRLAVLRNEKITLNKEYQPDSLTRNSIEEIDDAVSNLPLGNKLMFDYYKKNLLPEDYDNLVKGSTENIASYLEPEFKSTIENAAKERNENHENSQKPLSIAEKIDFAVSDPFRNLLGMNVSADYRDKSLGERASAWKKANATGHLDETRGDTWGMATALNAGYWFGPTSRLPMANLAAQGLYDIGTEHIPNLYNEGTTNWGDLGMDAVDVAFGTLLRKGFKAPFKKDFWKGSQNIRHNFNPSNYNIGYKKPLIGNQTLSLSEKWKYNPNNPIDKINMPTIKKPILDNKYFHLSKQVPIGFKSGGEYDLTDSQIKKLEQDGYEIEYM